MLRRNTVIVLVVFAVLLSVVVVFQNNRASQPGTAALTPPPTPLPLLFDVGAASLTGIRVSDPLGNSTAFVQGEDGSWRGEEPEYSAGEIDQAALSSLASQLASMRMITTLENPPALDALGLAPPNYQAVFTFSNGASPGLEIGDEAPTGNGFYVQQGQGAPGLVSKPAIDQLINLLEMPPLIPTPVITITATETISPTIEATATAQP